MPRLPGRMHGEFEAILRDVHTYEHGLVGAGLGLGHPILLFGQGFMRSIAHAYEYGLALAQQLSGLIE